MLMKRNTKEELSKAEVISSQTMTKRVTPPSPGSSALPEAPSPIPPRNSGCESLRAVSCPSYPSPNHVMDPPGAPESLESPGGLLSMPILKPPRFNFSETRGLTHYSEMSQNIDSTHYKLSIFPFFLSVISGRKDLPTNLPKMSHVHHVYIKFESSLFAVYLTNSHFFLFLIIIIKCQEASQPK